MAAGLLSSCVSQQLINRAEGRPGPMESKDSVALSTPNPLLYALIPVALPIDLLTYPFQQWYVKNNSACCN